ncbi:MAG: hypothetical protein LBR50_09905 [Tannerella sp.]|jgi:hypothetical protein|nr:hypothetical protein [Tannerella sp.]
MKVQQKYYDEIFDFKGQWDIPSKCGLKIVRNDDRTCVIVTELYQDNPGTSVTYSGRALMEQICAAKGLKPSEITYIECNPDTNSKLSFYDEEFFEVTFDGTQPPKYRKLTEGEVREIISNE